MVDVTGQIHGGGNGICLCIVLEFNRINVNRIHVPVCCILRQDALVLRLVGGQHISTTVQQVLIGSAELVAALSHEGCIAGHEGAGGNHGNKVGAGLDQGVLQGVVIQSLHTNAFQSGLGSFLQNFLFTIVILDQLHSIAVLIGAVHCIGQCELISSPLVVLSSTGNDVGILGCTGSCIVGITDIVRGVHKIVGSHSCNFITVLVHPLYILTEFEGPDSGIFIGRPFQSQCRLDIAEIIIFHQAINHIGSDGHFVLLCGDQIVQSGNFGSIQLSENSILCNCRCSGCCGSGGRFCGLGIAAAGSHTQNHRQCQHDAEQFLCGVHSYIISFLIILLSQTGRKEWPL